MHRLQISLIALLIGLLVGCSQHLQRNEISIHEIDFFPEGVTASADGTLYVGSLFKGTIAKASMKDKQTIPFIDDPEHLMSLTGITADPKRNVLWVCSVDMGFPGITDKIAPAVVAYTLDTGRLINFFPLAKGAFPNHITIGNDGQAYITDSFLPNIYMADLATEKITTWFSDKRFEVLPPNPTSIVHRINLNGIAFGADGNIYAVKTNTGEMYKITVNENGTAVESSVVELPHQLDRPDGLETLPDGSMIVVEAGSRIVRLSPKGQSFAMETIQDNLDFPTTTITLGNDIWVAESQFQHLNSPEQAAPFRLLRVPLPQ